jgi:hypothetical protein
MPLLVHRDGGFWHRDQLTGVETPLTPGASLERLSGMGRQLRFTARPYPERAQEMRAQTLRAGERRRAQPAAWLGS